MKKNLLLCFTMLSACFDNSVYGMEVENAKDPIYYGQPVSVRIQNAQKYSEFARKQCSEDTAHPKLWISSDDSFRKAWNGLADIFDKAKDLYNRGNVDEGDIYFDFGLASESSITYRSIPFSKEPNVSMREAVEDLFSSLEGIEGSPANNPIAVELWRKASDRGDLNLNFKNEDEEPVHLKNPTTEETVSTRI
ncbi:MAG: hypothetical protein IJA14_03225, partial [Alphaproteobacteria bacterium]|nr:hypothetical protein [Alphaproteobacteria bacterium]